jgi:hypothetical protein
MISKKKLKLCLIISLSVILLAIISISVYIFFKGRDKDTQEDSSDMQVVGVEKVKQDLLTLIPGRYEVIVREQEQSYRVDGCIVIYEIYPKEYSEIEIEYLSNASIIYCEDINNADLRSQVGGVRYNREEDNWFYIDQETRTPQEEMTFGTNLVTFSELWGSHNSWEAYILRLENSNELVILLIPSSNRIRCEVYDEDGVETMDQDCVDFRDSLPSVYIDWVPENIYDNYYNDLFKILERFNF